MAIIALNLTKMPVPNVVMFGRKIHTNMTLNAATFTAPPITLTVFNTQVTDLENAQEAAVPNGSRADVVNRNNKLAIVINSIKTLAAYVTQIAQGDEATILMAGMEVKKKGPRRYDTLAVPGNVRVKATNEGSVVMKWNKVHNAGSYGIEHCADPVTPDGWQNGTYNTGSNATIINLPQLTRRWFRVRAIGSEGMLSDWSTPTNCVVT